MLYCYWCAGIILFIVNYCPCYFQQLGQVYASYQLYHAVPHDEYQLTVLRHLLSNAYEHGLDFWKFPNRLNESVHVMVKPTALTEFLKSMQKNHLVVQLKISDVQKLIEKKETFHVNMKSPKTLRRPVGIDNRFSFTRYHSYEDMVKYMQELHLRFPEVASMESIGKTREGREIQLMKIGLRGAAEKNGLKPSVWIDAGIHAREWVTPAVAMFVLHQLVTGYNSDPGLRSLVQRLDWYIIPVLNPDGYEYSRSSSHPEVRLWRKNRSPPVCLNSNHFNYLRFQDVRRQCCQGVDLNRNFDFYFGGEGTSKNPCDETYQGKWAFSEPETRAVRDFLLRRGINFQAFITMHSYGQFWMYPYGYKKNTYPSDVYDLKRVALEAKSAIQALYGTRYTVGSGADVLYPSAGGSDDFAKDRADVKFVYLLELRPADDAANGFILSPSEILPTARETWQGLQAVAKAIVSRSRLPGIGATPNVLPFSTQLHQRVSGVSNQLNRGSISNYLPRNGGPSITVCTDRDERCEWWATFGGCRVWKDMDMKCAKSCGLCDDDVEPCQDSHKECSVWTERQLCRWIQKSCRRSCGICR